MCKDQLSSECMFKCKVTSRLLFLNLYYFFKMLMMLQMLTQFNTHLKFGITLITQTVNFRSFPFLRLMFVSFALAILQLHRISGNCLVISGSPPRPQIGPSTNRLAGGSLQDCSTYTCWYWYTWVMLWLTT